MEPPSQCSSVSAVVLVDHRTFVAGGGWRSTAQRRVLQTETAGAQSFVGERQHSSSRIASVATAAATAQLRRRRSSVVRLLRPGEERGGGGGKHPRGQQLLFQQLLILLCHGDSHVVTKIFQISTGHGLRGLPRGRRTHRFS